MKDKYIKHRNNTIQLNLAKFEPAITSNNLITY